MTQEGKTEERVPLVSVIVPVCNVEDYLEQCLEGLRNQTLENIEFILVDDGSKDACPQILAREAPKDPRMHVITKPNGGYGSGINRGLSEAQGLYVGIVEPDDWVEPHMYEDLFRAAHLPDGEMADIVKSAYWEYYDFPGETPFLKRPNLMKCMPKTSFSANIKENSELLIHHPSIWSAIYRRAFLEEKEIRMIEAPGGGWVDNPFLYEAFLQAEKYVWIPAAYYYYRQTNPNSSSNMKNYRLPYERLRDIRAVYERLDEQDPQLKACMYARHFYYTYSTIGEWGFSEKDPQVRALIHEAVSSVDPDILNGNYNGILPDYISYYESVVRDPAEKIAAYDNVPNPRVSVVVPICDDRHVLVRTLTDLANQSLKEIEIICADCDSVDASYEIAGAFAAKDARFKVLQTGESCRAGGLKAAFQAAAAPVIALVYPGQTLPEHYLEDTADVLETEADMQIRLSQRRRTYCDWETDTYVSAKGNEAQLLLNAMENPSCCAFRSAFLRDNAIEIRPADESGMLLMLEAICKAEKVSLCFGPGPRHVRSHRKSGRTATMTPWEQYRSDIVSLDAAYALSKTIGPDALCAFRAMAVRTLLDAAGAYLYTRDGERIFDDLQDAFRNRYGLLAVSRTSFCNMDAFLLLEQRLTASYLETVRTTRPERRAGGRSSGGRKEPAYRSSFLYRTARYLYHGMRSVKQKVRGEGKRD